VLLVAGVVLWEPQLVPLLGLQSACRSQVVLSRSALGSLARLLKAATSGLLSAPRLDQVLLGADVAL
jgi:hypothetical protein